MSDPLSMPGSGDFFSNDREPDQNDRLIPMINIVFLLLTFFMIAGTFEAAELLNIEPPEAPVSSQELPEEGPVVLVDRNGVMAIGDETLDAEEVVLRLKELIGDKTVEVRLKADRAARVKVVLPFLKKLADADVNRVRLVALGR